MYYDLNSFDRDHYPIYLLLPSGVEIVAFRKTVSPPGRQKYIKWVEKKWDAVNRREVKEDLPRAAGQPTRFRPIDMKKFPDPLPPPAHVMQPPNWQSPPVPPSAPELPDPLEWRGDYNPPGRISREEARIRVLRALRTERSKKTVVRGATSHNGWASLSDVARLEVRAKGRIEYEHQDTTHIPNVGELWEPTRRDHGDWSNAMSWYNQLSRKHQQIVRERSFNPPSSFRQIGEGLGVGIGESGVRKAYGVALDRLVKIANRGER